MAISAKLEQALELLAEDTVRNNRDPGKICAWLVRVLKFREEVWPTLPKEMTEEILLELRRRRSGAR